MAKSKNITKVRKNIDAIDLKILKLLSLRRKQVIKITKFKKRSEIVDKKRINLMLKNLVQKGKKLKVESAPKPQNPAPVRNNILKDW